MGFKVRGAAAAGAIALAIACGTPIAAHAGDTVYAWNYQGTDSGGAYVYSNHLGGTITLASFVGDSFYGSEADIVLDSVGKD